MITPAIENFMALPVDQRQARLRELLSSTKAEDRRKADTILTAVFELDRKEWKALHSTTCQYARL